MASFSANDRVIATFSLGSSNNDDVFDRVHSSVDDRLSLPPCDSACESPASPPTSDVEFECTELGGANPTAMPVPDRHPPDLQPSLMTIMRWDLQGSSGLTRQTFIWVDQPGEAPAYLDAVDDVQKFVESLSSETARSTVDRAQNALHLAMVRLMEEFRNLLEKYGESMYPECVLDQVSDASLGTTIESNASDNNEGGVENGVISYDKVAKSRFTEEMTVPSEVVSSLCHIATRLVRSGYQTECNQVYVSLRIAILEQSHQRLGLKKLSIEEVERMPWNILESEIDNWIHAMKIAVGVLFPAEKQLCDLVFAASLTLSESCFVDIAGAAIKQFLNFGEAVAIGRRAPEKLDKILDMYEALRDLLPSFASPRSQVSAILSRLSNAAHGTSREIENAIQEEVSKDPVPGGAEHPQLASVEIHRSLVEDGSRNRSKKVPWTSIVMGSSSYEDFSIAFDIIMSAGLYFFDFFTNIRTAITYYKITRYLNQIEQPGLLSGIFPCILCIMIGANIVNAIIFRCTLPSEDRPVFQAYFFPLIQAWRLTKLFRATCTCRRMRSLKSDIKPIYNVLAVALEAAPQLILQRYVFMVLTTGFVAIQGDRPQITVDLYSVDLYSAASDDSLTELLISIIASVINSAYSGFTAVNNVRRKASRIGRLGIGVAGGVYFLAALVLRAHCFGLISIDGLERYRILVPLIIGGIALNFAHIYGGIRDKQQVYQIFTFLECVGYSCMSFTVGPLYAMLKVDEKRPKHGITKKIRRRGRFYIMLTAASITHLLPDVTAFIICAKGSWCKAYLRPPIHILHTHSKFMLHGNNVHWNEANFIILYVCALVTFMAIDVYARDEAREELSMSKDESFRIVPL